MLTEDEKVQIQNISEWGPLEPEELERRAGILMGNELVRVIETLTQVVDSRGHLETKQVAARAILEFDEIHERLGDGEAGGEVKVPDAKDETALQRVVDILVQNRVKPVKARNIATQMLIEGIQVSYG